MGVRSGQGDPPILASSKSKNVTTRQVTPASSSVAVLRHPSYSPFDQLRQTLSTMEVVSGSADEAGELRGNVTALATQPHGPGLADVRLLVTQTREMLAEVHDVEVAFNMVRWTSAAGKVLADSLKTCHGLGVEQFRLRQEVAEAHLRTERRAGELLLELQKNAGGRPPADQKGGAASIPTLRELGITSQESHRWQRIASIPREVFDDFLAKSHQGTRELTTAAALRLATRAEVVDVA